MSCDTSCECSRGPASCVRRDPSCVCVCVLLTLTRDPQGHSESLSLCGVTLRAREAFVV